MSDGRCGDLAIFLSDYPMEIEAISSGIWVEKLALARLDSQMIQK
jgi:hypothetical protein